MDACDRALIARVIRDDDHRAFERLVLHHQSAVRGFLRRMTGGDERLADELAQETFLRAYRGLYGFDGRARFNTWLFRIACNAFHSAIRRRKSHADVAEYENELAVESETAGSDLRHDIEFAMAKLPARQRLLISMCCTVGCTHEEAAEELDLPLGTVKTEILRGKEKLRRLLVSWNNGGTSR